MKTTTTMITLAILLSTMASAHHYAPTTSPQFMGGEQQMGKYVQFTDDLAITSTYQARWTRGPTNTGTAHLAVLCNGWKTCPWTIDNLGRTRNIFRSPQHPEGLLR